MRFSIVSELMWGLPQADRAMDVDEEPCKPALTEQQWTALDELGRRNNADAVLAAAAADVAAPLLVAHSHRASARLYACAPFVKCYSMRVTELRPSSVNPPSSTLTSCHNLTLCAKPAPGPVAFQTTSQPDPPETSPHASGV